MYILILTYVARLYGNTDLFVDANSNGQKLKTLMANYVFVKNYNTKSTIYIYRINQG